MNELLKEGISYTEEKQKASKKMSNLVNDKCTTIGLPREVIYALKDYKHYYQRGWTDGVTGPIVLDKDTKYKDRVSPTFKNLVTIVKNLHAAEMDDFLKPYIKACDALGVHITIEVGGKKPKINKMHLDSLLEDMDNLQTDICQLNDHIVEGLAPEAENQKFAPKDKFKNVVEYAYRISNGSEKATDSVAKQIDKNIMYSCALDEAKKA